MSRSSPRLWKSTRTGGPAKHSVDQPLSSARAGGVRLLKGGPPNVVAEEEASFGPFS